VDNDKFQEFVLQSLSTLIEGQQALEKRQQALEEGQLSLITGQKSLEKRQQALEEGQLSFVERMDRLEQLQTRMEQTLTNKVDALFDGYALRGDQIAGFKNHFDRRLDYISGDVNFLMRKYFQHDEEIRELRHAE